MNKLKNCLLLGVLLFACSVSAMDDAKNENIIDDKVSAEIEAFEALAKEALNTTKPTKIQRAGVETFRYMAKLVAVAAAAMFAVVSAEVPMRSKRYDAIPCLALIPWLLVDLFIKKKDLSLASLQKLQKYIEGLTPKQRSGLSELFKQKYASQFKDKITREKDGRGLKIGQGFAHIIDIAVPLLLAVVSDYYMVSFFVKGKLKLSCQTLFSVTTSFVAIVEIILAIKNLRFSNDYNKSLALQKIEDVLNTSK